MEFKQARLRLRDGSAVPSKTAYAPIEILDNGWVYIADDVRRDTDGSEDKEVDGVAYPPQIIARIIHFHDE